MSPPMIRDAASGVWGYPTSTMDWCEENYTVTPYIAEFWNTVSNFIFVVPPLTMAYHFWKYRLAELGHIVCFLLLSVVGIGSFAFHCTLLYESQLLDELPMIYGTCAMLYCIIESKGKPDACNTRLVAFLATVASLITIIYATYKNPLIFLWSYGIMAGALFILNINEAVNGHGSKTLLLAGTASYGFGFILWNIDNELCYNVRDIRATIPGVIGPVTQLHAWWHFFAGVGTFLSIIYSLHIRIRYLGSEPVLQILYRCLPYYVKGPKINNDANNNNAVIKEEQSKRHQTKSSFKLKSHGNGILDDLSRLI